ncbi:TetR/AcrR family transcriptional regulator C-terminal domain-containing protein [Vagococcus sp. DIV0080]|uniref:TetR/AcrR family transcriptional regulator C-terminal domain-containing protein n=1 Tax=Candidatus Vagococcus giribetii TaxID=2230876 RepID=A0ABS3HVE7_9ENTE|nr:TetR/AcrR family transcriptional regulator C-terminal domain-containing protein [Vagococcus sp. DIV0080]MBO0477729.1 TetR/AcrR family transcriptional regulator C-terminal domain-containing protein [Vagococcus sp. DIV0080]
MNLTKKALSQALKTLMTSIAFEKITINDITMEAGVSRNTFYYHFSDINELLEWTFDNEIVKGLESYEDLNTWKEGLLSVLNYTEENRKFCLNTFHSINRDRLEIFLYNITYHMLISIMDQSYSDKQLQQPLKSEIADFYGRGIVAQVTHWLTTRLEEPKDDLINRIEGVTKGTIELIIKNH